MNNSSQDEYSDDTKYCWVCFESEEEDTAAAWVKPCKCRGTTKWVHQSCLQRWIDEKQKGNLNKKVLCQQCNTEYIMSFPAMGPVVLIMDVINNAVNRMCPFIAAGIVVCSVYWTGVTYGALTIMQVVGFNDGLKAMDSVDPTILLVALPTIPVVLILSNLLSWEDSVLILLRKYSPKIPLLKYIMPSFTFQPEEIPMNRYSEVPPVSEAISATRILCSALLFPTFATICGKVLFQNTSSNLNRTLLGGIAFIAIKGCLTIYYKQQQYIRKSKRKILDYEPPETMTTT